jgi:hypothetical protein
MKHGVVIAICVLAIAGVASPVAAHRGSADSGGSFCASLASIVNAKVTRLGSAPGGSSRRFTFPVRVSIESVSRARLLASALCGLPKLPSGVLHCPVAYSLRYEVAFTGAGGRASIEPFGCQQVSGAGPVRWAARTPAFWRTLGRALGIPRATRSTFQGRRP